MDIYDEAVEMLETGELTILTIWDIPGFLDGCDESCNCPETTEEDIEDESGIEGEEYELDICGKHLYSGECDDTCINMGI